MNTEPARQASEVVQGILTHSHVVQASPRKLGFG